jgi:hypothetical protein
MIDHIRAKGPKFWWVVTSGLTHVLDHKNLTKAQKVLFELDADAFLYLIDALSFEMFDRVNHKGITHELWESIKHTFGDSSTWDDGKFKKEDEPKVEAHECVEHDHSLVIVEDCSSSWSSDDDERSTLSSLDKIDGDASSDAIEDATPCTFDGDNDGSCSDNIATNPSTTPHCFMSQGDTEVSNANVVDHIDSYDELVSRLDRMTMSLENEKAKTLKLENKNSFLKNSCEDGKHLLDVLKSSHDELILNHEKLLVSHEELLEQHASLIKMFSKKIKNNESSSHESSDQLQHVTNSCDVSKKHVSTSCDDIRYAMLFTIRYLFYIFVL